MLPIRRSGSSTGEGAPALADDSASRTQILRLLLRTFVVLTGIIALIGVGAQAWPEAVVSAAGCLVYLLLLLALPRAGAGIVGPLCVAWYFLLAFGAMAVGSGIHDISTLLLPAGVMMAAVVMEGAALETVLAVSIAGVGAIGYWKLRVPEPHGPGSIADVVVAMILMLVSGVMASIVVRTLRRIIDVRRSAEGEATRAARELEARNEALKLVNGLSHRLQRTLDLEGIARETIAALVRRSQPPLVAFYVLDESGERLRMVDGHGFTEEEYRLGAELPVAGSMSGLAVSGRRIVTSDSFGEDSRSFAPVASALARRGVVAVASIPIVFDASALGTINLLYRHPRTFSRQDLETYQVISEAVSLAMTNARLVKGLLFEAYHDSLTRLPNRSSLHRRFEELRRRGEMLGLVLLDISRFRTVNEAFGHHRGDELLIALAERLAATPQPPHETFRLGGDEFAVLLPAISAVDEAEQRTGELLRALAEPFHIGGIALEVGATAGLAIHPTDGGDSHALLRCADIALYHAKRKASAFAVYSHNFDEHTPERLALASELGRAIREGELALWFQPKVSLADGSIRGVEALVRWDHPTLGLLLPAQFLSFAETSDMIHPLTDWVVEKALEQLGRWTERYPELTMAINLSARNLLDRSCPDRVDALIRQMGIAPSRVEIELTETALMTDPETALAMLGRITATGVRLAIDDFGTGYSSLAYLRRFPVDVIKIDRSFVSEMATGEQSRAIVHSTVQLARSLGLSVVAEGIEDKETADALREAGCEMAQGFYFAAPAPAAEIVQLFDTVPMIDRSRTNH